MRILERTPWFIAVPAFLGAVVIVAFIANYLGADYFQRTHLEEANPLAAAPEVAATLSAPPSAPGPTASVPTPASGAPQPSGPVVLASGMFRDGEPGHRGSGTATLGRDAAGTAVLVFEGFSVTNGPDLHVILGATNDGGGDGLNLGRLKATDGTFSYEVPATADLAAFKSVTIWCASFPTIFAVATLEA